MGRIINWPVLLCGLMIAAAMLGVHCEMSQVEAQPSSANEARKLMEYERRKAEALEKQVDVLEDIETSLDQIERRCRTR